MFIALLHVSAASLSQKVTLTLKDAPLENVFNQIKQQTGLSFLWDEEILKQTKPVTIDVQNMTVSDVLDMCLKNQGLSYSILQNMVVIKKITTNPETKKNESPPPVEVHGRVTDAHGVPLDGTNITIKRTQTGTITDAKGGFILKNVLPNDVIVISYIGYKDQNIIISDRTTLNIVLQVTDNPLDQVVVQGYGETSQRLATGDMAVVSAAEIEKQPVINPLMALQGRVAGLDIQQTSGYASAPIKAEIRGRSSVDPNQISEPLYVIDGVPLTVLQLQPGNYTTYGSPGIIQNGGLLGPAFGQSLLFGIDPADIESITVLKDADATSIYGSRGANGVILVTTKKGKAGKTQLNIHIDEGVNAVTRYWQLLNTPQYLEMRREAFKNDGIAPDAGTAPDLLVWDTTRYTDWQKALFGKTGRVINAQASLSGGDIYTTFRIGANYVHSTEITTASGADQRASVSFNVTHHSLDQRLTISLSSTYSFTQSDMIQMPGNAAFAPDAPAIYDSSGHLNWAPWDAAYGGPGSNPFGRDRKSVV